jgi:hypothetical protein
MQTCFTPLLLLALAVFVMMTLLRWFEQTTEAVERRWWNKVVLLVAMPFSVWFYPSRVAAGRPSMVPRHEPVRGFGKVSLTDDAGKRPHRHGGNGEPAGPAPAPMAPPPSMPSEGPPPGTPPEFLGMPVIPLRKKSTKPAVDPEKLAKLRQKMREQGMLPDEPDSNQS